MSKKYDTIVIGGGFYGLRIAQFLVEELNQKKVLVIEKEESLMSRASYNNQARVHNGYHYPRSVLTALRSRVNLPVFSEEYEKAVVNDFTKYYGIASNFSKVSAQQFHRFYERIGAKIEPAKKMKAMFDPKMIDEVFKVEEYAFNSRTLKEVVCSKLSTLGVDIMLGEKVLNVMRETEKFEITTDKDLYESKYVINTTYSSLNHINRAANLPIIPLKHEMTEMCLVTLPEEMEGIAFTIMCGPFYSIMPFPDKKLHTLSHVRYTPHSEWHDDEKNVRDSHKDLNESKSISHFPQMSADLKRFMPKVGPKVRYSGESLWEVKTVLPQSEGDDSRPILYKDHYGGLQNYICIMGGKIDNIYDVFKELKLTYET